jgi:hypothetical protein
VDNPLSAARLPRLYINKLQLKTYTKCVNCKNCMDFSITCASDEFDEIVWRRVRTKCSTPVTRNQFASLLELRPQASTHLRGQVVALRLEWFDWHLYPSLSYKLIHFLLRQQKILSIKQLIVPFGHKLIPKSQTTMNFFTCNMHNLHFAMASSIICKNYVNRSTSHTNRNTHLPLTFQAETPINVSSDSTAGRHCAKNSRKS